MDTFNFILNKKRRDKLEKDVKKTFDSFPIPKDGYTPTDEELLTLIKDGGGTVVSDYLNIQHSVASPTISTWYAGLNSINNNSVTTAGSGWIFETRIKATVSNLKIYIGGQTTIL